MKSVIRLNQVNKSFGAHKVLDGVSFDIEAGEPVALVGANGAGKTTLFSIICGFLKADSGSVNVLGESVVSYRHLSKLSALIQDAEFDPDFSIARQLTLFAKLQGMSRKQAQMDVERVLELTGLKEYSRQKSHILSHGMKKRLSIAQSLLGSPQVILLDEPTAGLDPDYARQISNILVDIKELATLIISSHQLEQLQRICPRVMFLKEGKVKLSDNFANPDLSQVIDQNTGLVNDAQLHTLTLRCSDQLPGLINKIKALPVVESIIATQRHEFKIQYPAGQEPYQLELALLALFAQNHWHYEQLINGDTLENQWFSQNGTEGVKGVKGV
ncbi:ABC transporter ATP-binding protein [Thalassotalea litorea]|uniref:ABC transporter ATP-binding protein n=1 Tax=Thalassotalea litorea TaxID=2020715 RepID=A0A5R9IMY4_9GAMM|nr:ABC transporter ATP-binding protein [Thalassotalea litorea]TLU61349.1 ABC transporter ATP-binding protein [Thalassotalea litorea]